MPGSTRHITLFASSLSGRGRALQRGAEAARILRAGGWTVTFRVTREQDRLEPLVASAGSALIGAVGGDGFVARLARAVANTPGRVLVPFPGGSGNDFCRAIGAGTSLRRRAKDIAGLDGKAVSRRVRMVDGMLVEASGGAEPLLAWGVLSVGIDAAANLIANHAGWLRGSPSYIWGAAVAFVRHGPTVTEGSVDGHSQDLSGWISSVSNSGWMGGGINLVPSSRLDDGQLELFNVGTIGRLRALPLLAKVLLRGKLDSPEVHLHRGTSFRIVTKTPVPVMADGDQLGTTPVYVTVVPEVVPVLMGRGRDR